MCFVFCKDGLAWRILYEFIELRIGVQLTRSTQLVDSKPELKTQFILQDLRRLMGSSS